MRNVTKNWDCDQKIVSFTPELRKALFVDHVLSLSIVKGLEYYQENAQTLLFWSIGKKSSLAKENFSWKLRKTFLGRCNFLSFHVLRDVKEHVGTSNPSFPVLTNGLLNSQRKVWEKRREAIVRIQLQRAISWLRRG